MSKADRHTRMSLTAERVGIPGVVTAAVFGCLAVTLANHLALWIIRGLTVQSPDFWVALVVDALGTVTLALSFESGQYREEDGMKYHTYPSLKPDADRSGLWDGVMKSDLSFTATDSSFTTYLDKIAGRNVRDIRGGNVGIEIRMGVNYSEAVVKRGMSLERYAEVTSTNAAKLLGLYPQKGAISVGSDADFAIIDPSVKKALAIADLHVRDYSPWEGWEITGWPTTVILRGKVMVDGGKLLGGPDDGRLVSRKIAQPVLQRPVF